MAHKKTGKMAGTDRKKAGKLLRQKIPHRSHGEWTPKPGRPAATELLRGQDEGRIEHLLPIKYGRMLDSPFAFYRGSAAVMAADLADTPVTDITVMLCGDAHLSNFGIFATPERQMVFDLNDFDEAFPGSWEWDLKRLVASAVVSARNIGISDSNCRDLACGTASSYCLAMDHFSRITTLERWYYYVEVEDVLEVFKHSSKKGRKSTATMVKKAKRRTQEQTLEKLTRLDNGQRRIISNPPLVVPVSDMSLEKFLDRRDVKTFTQKKIRQTWHNYLASLPEERRYLLGRYEITDVALRVGGIGSVGTRCFIALLEGETQDDCLILQFKEAGTSVLEPYFGTKGVYDSHSQRVTTAQRLMGATSDIFLGWGRGEHTSLDYYWRQLKDMKGSADIASMDLKGLKTYLAVCSWCLARAHARTGSAIKIRGYLGRKDTFAKAVGSFAMVYANQTERDYEELTKAVKSGRIPAETGV